MVLDKIKKENDVKKLNKIELPILAEEIREFLLENVSETGGHLASNLGVVELTIALHRIMNFPNDKIVFDVGHQAYVHKILTGRKDDFPTLRKLDGLCGFPKRKESDCDAFGAGHSSTSISAALGLAYARDLAQRNETVIAVIGDGALSGGMAYEALNNLVRMRKEKKNFIVILNDNNMSISENVGGMSRYLNLVRSGKGYVDFKINLEKSLSTIPHIGKSVVKTLKSTKDSIKQFFVPGMFFEDMGITYIGPVDGHNIEEMTKVLRRAKKLTEPVVIHVLTKKGKGYEMAEENPSKFHGVNPFDIQTGEFLSKKKHASYTDVFAKKMIELAAQNQKIVAITAAMPTGTGLSSFKKEYPDRFFDVGIAEEHAVTFAAGLAAGGMKPVVAIYSTFLQRAYDQMLHDVCLQKLPVVFAIDRSGIVGADGETHQGIYDISYLTSIPNMVVMAPKNRYELCDMLEFAIEADYPVAIKYARGDAFYGLSQNREPVELGRSEELIQGKKVAVLAVGSMVETVYKAVTELREEGYEPALINVRFIKPFDQEKIEKTAQAFETIIVVEENVNAGSFGQAVTQFVAQSEWNAKVICCNLPDLYLEHGAVNELKKRYHLDKESIKNVIIERMN